MTYLIYARVSPKGSTWAAAESSIDMQIESCKRFIHGEPSRVIKDEFFTAENNKRPGLIGILADLEAGTADWDTLIVYRLDRLTRSLLNGEKVFQALRNNNKGFISVTERMDFSSPMGRAMLGIINVFAQLEREQLAERTRDKMHSMAAKGEYTCGICPYGYKRPAPHVNTLVIDERPAEEVRDIFKLYISGKSTNQIHLKYKDKRSKNQIINILRNKHYLGLITCKGQEFQGKHEPIIDQETFDRVQRRLPNKQYNSREAAQKYPYLLTGLLYCSCGKRLTPASYKDGTFHYYKCTDPLCKAMVSAPKLEKSVIDYISNYKMHRKDIEQVCAAIKEEKEKYLAGNAPELIALGVAVQKTRKEVDKTANAFLSGKNRDYWDDRLLSLRQELQRLELRRSELLEASKMDLGIFEDATAMADMLKSFADALNREPDNVEAKRQAITSHISRLSLSSPKEFLMLLSDGTSNVLSGSPDITWKYQLRILLAAS